MDKKVSELTGAELDLWVAKAQGLPVYECGSDSWPGNGKVNAEQFERHVITVGLTGRVVIEYMGKAEEYSPSSYWMQGGPIIDREKIWFEASNYPREEAIFAYIKTDGSDDLIAQQYGSTYLIAAMRAYVASKYGDALPTQEPTT